jgi:hypothetical protein
MFASRAEKDALAQRKAALGEFVAKLSELPQFIKTGSGLLHALNGCLVTIDGESIKLCWVETYAGSDGRRASLYSQEQLDKYLALMIAQAATLKSA